MKFMSEDNTPFSENNASEFFEEKRFKGTNHSFDVGIAMTCGVHAAVIFNHICHWIGMNKIHGMNHHEGRNWTYQTRQQIAAHFPYLTVEQVRHALEKLVAEKFLLCSNFHENKFRRDLWYAVPDESVLPIGKISKNSFEMGNFPNRGGRNPKTYTNNKHTNISPSGNKLPSGESAHDARGPNGPRAASAAPPPLVKNSYSHEEECESPGVTPASRFPEETAQSLAHLATDNRSDNHSSYNNYFKEKNSKINNYSNTEVNATKSDNHGKESSKKTELKHFIELEDASDEEVAQKKHRIGFSEDRWNRLVQRFGEARVISAGKKAMESAIRNRKKIADPYRTVKNWIENNWDLPKGNSKEQKPHPRANYEGAGTMEEFHEANRAW